MSNFPENLEHGSGCFCAACYPPRIQNTSPGLRLEMCPVCFEKGQTCGSCRTPGCRLTAKESMRALEAAIQSLEESLAAVRSLFS